MSADKRTRTDRSTGGSHVAFLQAVYRGCLRREPDPEGLRNYLKLLESNALGWEGVLESVLSSEEFLLQYEHRSLSVRAMHSLHRARMILFRECLPAAGVVVDLGGASTQDPEGALFALGYPHAPKELVIVDLPPDQRVVRPGTAEPRGTLRASRGTWVRYLYGPMSDLHTIADASVDLVVSGQSIEHVTEEEADRVCGEAFRVLKPGGHFCLDTPNARVTRIQSPGSLIHPEHKKEYLVSELKDKLVRHGFRLAASKGVCPMPGTVASQLFDFGEMARNCALSDDVGNCYLFFLDVLKPAAATP